MPRNTLYAHTQIRPVRTHTTYTIPHIYTLCITSQFSNGETKYSIPEKKRKIEYKYLKKKVWERERLKTIWEQEKYILKEKVKWNPRAIEHRTRPDRIKGREPIKRGYHKIVIPYGVVHQQSAHTHTHIFSTEHWTGMCTKAMSHCDGKHAIEQTKWQ